MWRTIKRKCVLGCGRFQPYFEPGTYHVRSAEARLYAQPQDGRPIAMLRLGEKVQVVSDAGRIESKGAERASWVFADTSKGKGYIFGGFLRIPQEPQDPFKSARATNH